MTYRRLWVLFLVVAMTAGCQSLRRIADSLGFISEADGDWQERTDKLNAAIKAGSSADTLLPTVVPDLVTMVKADAQNQQIFKFWGTSINYDEGAKGEIVAPEIVAAIGRLAGQPMEGRNVHAGLMHTYGYLLSNLATPYGYKRERWTLPTIDQGLGWAHGPVSPQPKQGTLLLNVTALAGKIAFRDDAKRLQELNHAIVAAAPEIRSLDTKTLNIKRLVEQVDLVSGDAKKANRRVIIQTDIVSLPQAKGGDKSMTHLLIYSINDSSHPGSQLITAFPMTESAANGVFLPENIGAKKLVTTRYNAFVPGLTGSKVEGSRTIAN